MSKAAKDTLVASLFELSKAANEVAAATVTFFNLTEDVPEAVTSLSSSLANVVPVADKPPTKAAIAKAAKAAAEDAKVISDAAAQAIQAAGTDSTAVAVAEKPKKEKKKKKVIRDPNAPKKPLTIYFAFSFLTREQIRDERAKAGESAMSAIEMNDLVKARWTNITKEDKEYWQTKYANELKAYQIAKEAYKASLLAKGENVAAAAVNAVEAVSTPAVASPIVTPVLAPVPAASIEEESDDEEKKKKKEKKRKAEKSEKKEKKEKKKKVEA